MYGDTNNIDHFKTQREKNANDFQWYKDVANTIGTRGSGYSADRYDRYRKMRVNYQLMNDRINLADFEYVSKPFGAQAGELPANFINRDIISPKIKTLLGLGQKRPFTWGVIATNENAVNERKEFQFKKIQEYVEAKITQPIRQEAQMKAAQAKKGQQLSQQEEQQIMQQIEAEVEKMKPERLNEYMKRSYKQNHSIMSEHIINYIYRKQNLPNIFTQGLEHAAVAGVEVYYVGEQNGEVTVVPVNPLFFTVDKPNETINVQDGESVSVEYRMTKGQIAAAFGRDLGKETLKKIFSQDNNGHGLIHGMDDATFHAYFDSEFEHEHSGNTYPVVHTQIRGLKKIGFLEYLDRRTGVVEEIMVDENYVLNKEAGDIRIEWEWIPEIHEVWKIGQDAYARMRPVPDQYGENIFDVKLSYVGGIYDNTNAESVSLVDRIKAYQYFYNIIIYRIELLLASDKGKILMMNIDALPESAGVDIEKFMYFMEANKIAFYQTSSEGKKYDPNVGAIGKEIDMSLANNIAQYIQLAETIEHKAGKAIGLPEQMEGQITAYERVGNVQQALAQSNLQLETFFSYNDTIKASVVQRMLDVGKQVYRKHNRKVLAYMTDDLTAATMELDHDLLADNDHMIYIESGMKAAQIKAAIEQLAESALHSQKMNLSSVISVLKQDSLALAENILRTEEERFIEQQSRQAREVKELENQNAQAEREFQKELKELDHEYNMAEIREKGKIEIQKQAMLSIGFNEDKDADNDGQLDVLEIAREGVKASIEADKMELEKQKFQHQIEQDKEKNEIERKKLAKTAIKK